MAYIVNLKEIEEKWQKRWEEVGVFEADHREDKEKFYITVAYPYPSGGMHIGHVRTYTLPDVFARFKRMQGKNVLFPMGWHVTGTPIIGALERLKRGEEKQLRVFKGVFRVADEDIDDMEEPMDFAEYFIEKSYKPGMRSLGYSVDWRREFTTNDKRYNRFIEWQYNRLRDKGLLEKGKHPTKFCLNDENPVTTHDLLEGEDAEKQEYTLVKFELNGKILPMATLRPETVYGVTHTLINPEEDYVEAEVGDETWIVSQEAAEKLEHQDREVEVERDFKGEELVGEKVENMVTGDEVLMLPATFVDPEAGSGVVMSVPGHAPYDWISLKDIQRNDEILEEYGLPEEEVKEIEPISIIEVEGYGKFPAKEACEERGIESQGEEDRLEEATEEIYKKEFHTGTLKSNCGEFAGKEVEEVKGELEERFSEEGKFSHMWDFSEPVVCRCGGKVIVAETDSWFLKYGKKSWKDKAFRCLNHMETVPEETRDQYSHTIDWLESWPCIRNYGLGTKLPFDEKFIVEPLSDSTLYMAFYTISHLINDVDPEKFEPEFFDHVFLDEGSAGGVEEQTGIDEEKVNEIRRSFDYWYPLDWRTSADELVENHLTFFIFHHSALFPEDRWPEGIATWGMGTLEGKAMSSSKGHLVLAEEAIEEYGADTTRFFLFASAEPWQSFDWKSEKVESYRNKVTKFYEKVRELYGSGEREGENTTDRYLLSRMNFLVKEVTGGLEDFQTRKAGMKGFFEMEDALNWYIKMNEEYNEGVLKRFLETWVRLMAPFTPHVCEELWERMGKDGFVSTAEWPEVDESKIDETAEASKELVDRMESDIREIKKITGIEEPEKIKVIVAAPWKHEVHKKVLEGLELREIMEEELEKKGEKVAKYYQELSEEHELEELRLGEEDEIEALEEMKDFLSEGFGSEVVIEREEESKEEKASEARPEKPAIVLKE